MHRAGRVFEAWALYCEHCPTYVQPLFFLLKHLYSLVVLQPMRQNNFLCYFKLMRCVHYIGSSMYLLVVVIKVYQLCIVIMSFQGEISTAS